jgi:hypothetical protein
MIEQSEVGPLLVEACPAFAEEWRSHVAEHGNDLLYVAAGDFARHLLLVHQRGEVAPLVAAARVIEQLHREGSPWVKEFATIGILEGVQNVWSNNQVDPERFAEHLLPESQRWWRGLNKFWSGQASVVRADG